MECREFLQRKDIGYVASFDPNDDLLVQKFMNRANIQEYRVQHLIDKFDRFYDDHKPKIYGKPFEPIKMTKKGNKLVNQGLIALAEMQVGKRTRIFDYYVIGENSQTVSIQDQGLIDQCAITRITTSGGNIIQRQSTVFYSVFFDRFIPDCTVRETGIVDSELGNSKLLLRTVLPNTVDQIPHRQSFDTIFVAHVVYSGSV